MDILSQSFFASSSAHSAGVTTQLETVNRPPTSNTSSGLNRNKETEANPSSGFSGNTGGPESQLKSSTQRVISISETDKAKLIERFQEDKPLTIEQKRPRDIQTFLNIAENGTDFQIIDLYV